MSAPAADYALFRYGGHVIFVVNLIILQNPNHTRVFGLRLGLVEVVFRHSVVVSMMENRQEKCLYIKMRSHDT